MEYYTYIHTRKDNNKVFYVGKGKGKRAFTKEYRNKHWHNVVNKAGYTVDICAYWETEKEALEHEKFLIQCFKSLTTLVNKTDGGDGISGYRHSEESKKRMSEIRKGKSAYWNIGRTPPEATRLKMSKAQTGKKHTEATKKKMSVAQSKENNAMWGKKNLGRARAVKCIDTGEVFYSATEAALKTNSSRSAITSVCLGLRKTTNNLRWCYNDLT
jgi:group I intron endonuclease